MAEIEFKLLEVDLTHETSRVVDVTEDVKKYLGARGLANKLMWDLVPQGIDPLCPDNILHFGVGPLTGLIGSKTILSFISPLTGWAGRSSVSGDIGDEIVRARYNTGILVKGKASKPVYLYVFNDRVEIRDASDLWGEWKQKTEVTLRDHLNQDTGELFSVLCIGPAGENLVRYANATTEFIHSASKWGCGAVMGSKNLKAIAVRGTMGPLYADHARVWELFRTYASHASSPTDSFFHSFTSGTRIDSGSPSTESCQSRCPADSDRHLGRSTFSDGDHNFRTGEHAHWHWKNPR